MASTSRPGIHTCWKNVSRVRPSLDKWQKSAASWFESNGNARRFLILAGSFKTQSHLNLCLNYKDEETEKMIVVNCLAPAQSLVVLCCGVLESTFPRILLLRLFFLLFLFFAALQEYANHAFLSFPFKTKINKNSKTVSLA